MPAIWNIKPSKELLATLEGLQGNAILAGPHHEVSNVLIDRYFATAFPTALEDFCTDAGFPHHKSLLQPIGTSLDAWANHAWAHAERIREIPDLDACITAELPGDASGVVALQRRLGGEGARIVGLFTGATLCVDVPLRGFGLGRDLVMARLMVDGALPTWDHDKPSYSHGGAHVVAMARDRLLAEFRPENEPAL